jgi:hypothetical protein
MVTGIKHFSTPISSLATSKIHFQKAQTIQIVSIRSHSWIVAGVSLTPISLCHDLFIKGDQMEENSEQYHSNSETRPNMHRQVRS